MLSIFFKVFSVTFLAVGGVLFYRFPEQSFVLLLGVGLTAFSVIMRYRNRRKLNENNVTTSA